MTARSIQRDSSRRERGEDFMPSIGGTQLTDPDVERQQRHEKDLEKITNNVDHALAAPPQKGNVIDPEPTRSTLIGDMLDSGHGFLVRKIDKPKTVWRVTCEVCDGPLPTPGNDPDWLCQYYDETRPASLTCNCPWCLKYQDYLAGRYKPQGGRPRQRCGSKECERKADAHRKAQKRLEERREKLLAEYAEYEDEAPARVAWEDVPQEVREQVPPEIREQVRAKMNARLDFEPPVWNRKRRRNEPNWWLSFQRKRGPRSPVRKTP